MGKKLFKALFLVLLLSFSSLIPASLILAQEIGSKELLMFAEIPTVISAARKAQPLTEAPAFVTVVTAEDIRRSGAMSIPQALRMVPGLHVMELENGDWQIGMRGIGCPTSNGMADKLLVMIDGRSVYLDFYNTVLWSALEITLDDIERIEIVEGPASTLFGANAFAGVINIITKAPEQAKGTSITTIGGQRNKIMTSLVHANTFEDTGLSYKITGSWTRGNRWLPRDLGTLLIGIGTGLLEYKFDEDKKISFSGGHNEIERLLLAGNGIEAEGATGFLKLNYEEPDFYVRLYRNTIETDFNYLGNAFHVEGVTYDLEAQKTVNLSNENSLIIGASGRDITYKKTAIIENDKVGLSTWAAYLQDEHKFSDNFSLFSGGRFDYDDVSEKTYFSPRIAGVYSPNNEHVFRLSWGQAFRMPSIQEAFGDLTLTNPYGVGVPLMFLANHSIKPEVITSYELGYKGKPSDRTKVFGNIYYSTLKRLIDINQSNWFTYVDPPGVWVDTGLAMTAQYYNAWKGSIYGGEWGLDYLFTDWLTGSLNYTYAHAKDKTRNRDHEVFPAHKVNLGLRANWDNGFNADLNNYFVSSTKTHFDPYVDVLGSDLVVKTKSYVLTNLRVGYRFNQDSMELAINVFNLFDKKHRQYPGPTLVTFGGAELRRNVTVSFNYKF